jgi:hypothetical protein
MKSFIIFIIWQILLRSDETNRRCSAIWEAKYVPEEWKLAFAMNTFENIAMNEY